VGDRPRQGPRQLPRAVCGHDCNVQLGVVGSGVLEGGDKKDKLDDAVDSVKNKLN
jgi:hypothetical protein